MSKVVQLRVSRSKDTTGELRELLVKSHRGGISGLTFAVEFADGSQRIGFTGSFKSNRAEAVKMAHHLGELLRQIEDGEEMEAAEDNVIPIRAIS